VYTWYTNYKYIRPWASASERAIILHWDRIYLLE
jgi:hypothetical protein